MSFLENISLRIMFFLNYDSLTVRIVGNIFSLITYVSISSLAYWREGRTSLFYIEVHLTA